MTRIKQRITIGIDPGDSTGIAVFKEDELVQVFQSTPTVTMRILQDMLMVYGDEDILIACERFTQQRGPGAMTHQPTAQQVVGKVQHIAEQYGHVVHIQAPSDAHAIADNKALKKKGLLQSGDDVNSRDANDVNMAIRHALLLMSHHRATLFDKLMYGDT